MDLTLKHAEEVAQGMDAVHKTAQSLKAPGLPVYKLAQPTRATASQGNTDGLSHLPLPEISMQTTSDDATVFNLAQIQSLSVFSSKPEAATWSDLLLSRVLQYMRQGRLLQVPEELRSYRLKRNELTVEGDTVLWGVRVVVPSKLHK